MTSKILGLLLFGLGVTVFYSLVINNPSGNKSSKEVNTEEELTLESHDLIPECAHIHEELKKIGVSNSFQEITMQINEESLKNDDYLRIVSACFNKSAASQLNLAIDAFTSNFGASKGNDLLLQLSFIDTTTNNKLNETTVRFTNLEAKKNPE